MKLRSDYKDAFVEKHGVKLGLMSGFIKVCIGFYVIQLLTNIRCSHVCVFMFNHNFIFQS